ncbi:MAG: hypothetical protein KF757_05655 [Phycisphaeraceae bacterium]|nr:hypothetical protein [Phycisphaeraceae bacterium]MCW5763658.1 hypothetical protein [Phycisphaeraceae bacterium]
MARPTKAPQDRLWTVARIAEHLRVPRHRVEYIIDTRRINPIATAGIARVFAPVDVDRVGVELGRIDVDRDTGGMRGDA